MREWEGAVRLAHPRQQLLGRWSEVRLVTRRGVDSRRGRRGWRGGGEGRRKRRRVQRHADWRSGANPCGEFSLSPNYSGNATVEVSPRQVGPTTRHLADGLTPTLVDSADPRRREVELGEISLCVAGLWYSRLPRSFRVRTRGQLLWRRRERVRGLSRATPSRGGGWGEWEDGSREGVNPSAAQWSSRRHPSNTFAYTWRIAYLVEQANAGRRRTGTVNWRVESASFYFAVCFAYYGSRLVRNDVRRERGWQWTLALVRREWRMSELNRRRWQPRPSI